MNHLVSMTDPILALLTYPQINPVIVRLGPLAIRWYGLAYVLGFFIAYLILQRMARTGKVRITGEQLSDLMGWLMLGVLAGGRLGWWIFYHRNTSGQPEPWYEPVALWTGGMSFHGGLLGVLLALGIWTYRSKADFWNLADCMALVAPIGLFFGRIANFINGELVGRPTDVPWAMIFPGYSEPRHPSQLYEAGLEGIVLLLCLWVANRLRPREGRIAALFVILYGIFRFCVEFTREPDVQLGFIAFNWLTMGQLLSLLTALAGVIMWIARRKAPRIEK